MVYRLAQIIGTLFLSIAYLYVLLEISKQINFSLDSFIIGMLILALVLAAFKEIIDR